MKQKPTISQYTDLNDPDRELMRQNARKTPEELWAVYIRMRKMYLELTGQSLKSRPTITITRPPWM